MPVLLYGAPAHSFINMDLSGSVLLASTQRISDIGGAVLQQNQQVTAKILHVSNDSVMLNVMGYRLEARLSSPQQAELLKNATFAQFLVKGMADQTVQLQLLRTDQSNPATASHTGVFDTSTLAQSVLSKLGVPVDDLNLSLARTMLDKGMSLDSDTLAELRQVLTSIGKWGAKDIQNCLMLKEAGLPITASTLSLLANGKPELSDALSALRSQLNHILNQKPDLDPKILGSLKNALSQLDGFSIHWNMPSSVIKDDLQRIFQQIGNSVEKQLGNLIASGKEASNPANVQHLLTTLKDLSSQLSQAGLNDQSKAIDQFIQNFKGVQFLNSSATLDPGKEGMFQLDFPLVTQSQKDNPEGTEQSAKIRIGYHKDKTGSGGEPDFVRLVLQVDLEDGETVEADLSIVKQRMGVQINTSSEAVNTVAEDEFPSFEAALSEIGFEVASKRFRVISPKEREKQSGVSSKQNEKSGWVITNERFDMEA